MWNVPNMKLHLSQPIPLLFLRLGLLWGAHTLLSLWKIWHTSRPVPTLLPKDTPNVLSTPPKITHLLFPGDGRSVPCCFWLKLMHHNNQEAGRGLLDLFQVNTLIASPTGRGLLIIGTYICKTVKEKVPEFFCHLYFPFLIPPPGVRGLMSCWKHRRCSNLGKLGAEGAVSWRVRGSQTREAGLNAFSVHKPY